MTYTKQFHPQSGPLDKQKNLGRANAAKFLERLCKYPDNSEAIKEAKLYILEAHAERLTQETGKRVTPEEIEQDHALRPKILDMFSGGGAIPLEALRLGCDAYALDLNPVAYIIELCTLVFPQKYGKPDISTKGMTGPKNKKGETTWGGLAEEIRYWGRYVLERANLQIGDLYPLIPYFTHEVNRNTGPKLSNKFIQKNLFNDDSCKCSDNMHTPHKKNSTEEYLIPVAYLWTRTVKCKKPSCGATVPLLRQTWL